MEVYVHDGVSLPDVQNDSLSLDRYQLSNVMGKETLAADTGTKVYLLTCLGLGENFVS